MLLDLLKHFRAQEELPDALDLSALSERALDTA
jgi:hypothetical protein